MLEPTVLFTWATPHLWLPFIADRCPEAKPWSAGYWSLPFAIWFHWLKSDLWGVVIGNGHWGLTLDYIVLTLTLCQH